MYRGACETSSVFGMLLAMSASVKLNDGREMPQLGLGVWKTTDGNEVRAVRAALDAGYRHIDTAAIYGNEDGVGRAIAESGVDRESIWVTTKCWNADVRSGDVRAALHTSLKKLRLEYVDLYLVHWPVEGRVDAYREIEKLRREGLCRSIGVSNFMPEHVDELLAATEVVPAVNQVELHPYLQPADVLESCARHGIAIEGWSPLMQGAFKREPLFAKVGDKHGKSAAQVVIRWALQRGFITIPKSANPGRIQENGDVFDFEIGSDDMRAITALSRDQRFGPDPRNFSF